MAVLYNSQEDCDNDDVEDSISGFYYSNDEDFKGEVLDCFGFAKEDIKDVE